MIPQKAIYQFLDSNGNGLGTTNAIGNYASGSEFFFRAQGDCDLERMIVHIEDAAGIQPDEYGNLGAALGNGWELLVFNEADTEILDLTSGIAVTTNGGLGRYCYDLKVESWTAAPTNEFVQARWTFSRAGQMLFLEGGNKLSITFNDDLTGLVEHTFMVQGYYR